MIFSKNLSQRCLFGSFQTSPLWAIYPKTCDFLYKLARCASPRLSNSIFYLPFDRFHMSITDGSLSRCIVRSMWILDSFQCEKENISKMNVIVIFKHLKVSRLTAYIIHSILLSFPSSLILTITIQSDLLG